MTPAILPTARVARVPNRVHQQIFWNPVFGTATLRRSVKLQILNLTNK